MHGCFSSTRSLPHSDKFAENLTQISQNKHEKYSSTLREPQNHARIKQNQKPMGDQI